METKIVILASGRGSDFQSIIEHEKLGILENVKVVALVCNHDNVPVVQKGIDAGINVYKFPGVSGRKFANQDDRETAREQFDQETLEVIKAHDARLVVLAGFDQIVSKNFVDKLSFRILNIHPAYDLEKFGGKNMVGRRVHDAVIQSGAKFSGCTVHFVTSELDLGPAILKRKVEISVNESASSLEEKILSQEHLVYPEAIQLVSDNRVRVDEKTKACFVDQYSENWDVHWFLRQERYIAGLRKITY